jgi:hypothetical protein
METIRFKGGSLSGTYLCRVPGKDPFVRKHVSLTSNREYGFQRWYSQLKRLQRYGILFPGVFPKLITYGREGDRAYFDMEYIPDSMTAHEFVTSTPDRAKIDRFFTALVETMRTIHKVKIDSTLAPMELYIFEEIEQKINACRGNKRFQELVGQGNVIFNGVEAPGLATVLDKFKELALKAYRLSTETFTHGNLTLENILYQPAENRVVFIDPYEENVIDSVLAEYSQLFQSSNSYYEIYNAAIPTISGNSVEIQVQRNEGLDYFNLKLNSFLKEHYSEDDITTIKLLEVSQYARMLPFKMEIDENKMILFYALGSCLFDQALREWTGKHQ